MSCRFPKNQYRVWSGWNPISNKEAIGTAEPIGSQIILELVIFAALFADIDFSLLRFLWNWGDLLPKKTEKNYIKLLFCDMSL